MFFFLSFFFWLLLKLLFLVAVCRAFSSCGERGLLFVAMRGSSGWGAQAPGPLGFSGCGTWAQALRPRGLVALWHVESPQIRGQTRVPCTGRWILVRCTTKEVPFHSYCFKKYAFIWLRWLQHQDLGCSSWGFRCRTRTSRQVSWAGCGVPKRGSCSI